jgi:uncharacterized phage protein (TIGR01671 family)
MENRFKLRYFHKQTNKIYDVCFIDFDCPCVSLFLSKEELLHIGKRDFKSEYLMQCTGIGDIETNSIYEGDILKVTYTRPDGKIIKRNCVVEYDRGAFWINYGIGASYLYNDDCTYEIIGNVFQDKELLNEKI